MSVTIELPPEIEASLAAQAAAHGVALPEYLQHLLKEQAAARTRARPSPDERATLWRDGVKGLPKTKPLSDEAISRESIYLARG